ncbi:hypothetical protein ACJJTC_011807 [Scirpophaga incertulas]
MCKLVIGTWEVLILAFDDSEMLAIILPDLVLNGSSFRLRFELTVTGSSDVLTTVIFMRLFSFTLTMQLATSSDSEIVLIYDHAFTNIWVTNGSIPFNSIMCVLRFGKVDIELHLIKLTEEPVSTKNDIGFSATERRQRISDIEFLIFGLLFGAWLPLWSDTEDLEDLMVSFELGFGAGGRVLDSARHFREPFIRLNCGQEHLLHFR